jgi:hypothetical protein
MASIIVLLDCSGSMRKQLPDGRSVGKTLVSKILDRVIHLPTVRLIGWNSNNFHNGPFSKGVVVYDQPISTQFFDMTCAMLLKHINESACTEPYLGFDAISPTWFEESANTTIVVGTDGKMGWTSIKQHEILKLDNSLLSSVKKLPNNVNIEIICVEKTAREYSSIEETRNAAGFDVYKALCKDSSAVDRVVKLTSFCPGQLVDGFVHLERQRAPPGFLVFRGSVFPKNQLFEMRRTVILNAVSECETDDDIMIVVSDLATMLTKIDVTPVILDLFVRLFVDKPQYAFIAYTLGLLCVGKAAPLQSEVKNLFKLATSALESSVKNCLSPSDSVVTFVNVKNEVFITDRHRMNGRFGKYKDAAAVSEEGAFFANRDGSAFEQQCLRQWAREWYSSKYGVGIRSDTLMFAALEDAAYVAASTDHAIAGWYRDLAVIMLRKKARGKCLYDLLVSGQPIESSEWNRSMGRTAKFLQLGDTPASKDVWWWLLTQLEDQPLLDGQRAHCMPLVELKMNRDVVTVNQLPRSFQYSCPITLDDTKATGGHAIDEHGQCRPPFVFSEVVPNCPFCRSSVITWSPVLPYVEVAPEPEEKDDSVEFSGPKFVINLKGMVGAGKSTVALEIARLSSVSVARASMDKYVVTGMRPKDAVVAITKDVLRAELVVVDICNNVHPRSVFGYEVSGDAIVHTEVINYDHKKPREYMSWATLNVLNRSGIPSPETFNLSPGSSSVDICLSVAEKKARAVVGKKVAKSFFADMHMAPDPLKFLADSAADWAPKYTATETALRLLEKVGVPHNLK